MIETAVRSILLADPTVASLVGTRIYTGILPQRPTFPAITLKKVDKLSGLTLSDAVGPNTLRLQADCWANDVDGVRALADAVNGSDDQATAGPLHGFSGPSPSVLSHPDLFAGWNMDDPAPGYRRDVLGHYPLLDRYVAPGVVAVVVGAVGNGTSYSGGVAYSNGLIIMPPTFSVTGWFYTTSGTDNQYIFSYAANTVPGTVSIHLFPSVFSGVRFFTDDDPGDEADSGVALTLGAWHFFAATHDGATGANSIQVDGSVPVTVAAQPNPVAVATQLRIGRHNTGAGQLYGGLDALQIYSKVLTAPEIAVRRAGWEPTSTQRINLMRLIVERSTEYESDTKLYRVSADYAVHL